MSDSFIRHIVALIATLICLMAYAAGYVSGGFGWWWTVFAERPLRQAPEEISEENGTLGLPENHQVITSPFVGTFYSAPSPGAEAYVTLGKTVQSGDVVCIVEAMKLMNQIEVECPGKIIKQHVQNGQPVEFGEPLFTLEV
jgi:acetyl-CoA carboxylase biotin carboxyl carrier protein